MQNQNIAYISIGAVLCIVMLTAFLLPMVSSSTSTTTEINNEGIYFDKVTTGTHTIEYDQNNGEPILTVDNVDISDKLHETYTNPSDRMQVLAYGDYFNISFTSRDNVLMIYSQHESSPSIYATSATITITPTTVNVNAMSGVNPHVYDLTVSKVCMVSVEDNAQYVYCKNALIAEDTEIMGSYIYRVTSNFSFWRTINGTIDDLEVKGYSPVNGAEVALSDIEITKTTENVPAYTNIDKLTSLVVKTTGGGSTSSVVSQYVIVPASITADKATVPSDAQISLIELVPLLLVVSIVLGVLAFAMRARLS